MGDVDFAELLHFGLKLSVLLEEFALSGDVAVTFGKGLWLGRLVGRLGLRHDYWPAHALVTLADFCSRFAGSFFDDFLKRAVSESALR